jgi:hypothetical protein
MASKQIIYSVKLIRDRLKHITQSDARALKAAIEGCGPHGSNIQNTMSTANNLIGGNGVKVVHGEDRDIWYGDAIALFVDMGASYNMSVVYDTWRKQFFVMSIGDWVEGAEARDMKIKKTKAIADLFD